MDVTILAGDVLKVGLAFILRPFSFVQGNGVSVDIAAVGGLRGTVGQHVKVEVGDVVLLHVIGQEVHHRRCGVVLVQLDAGTITNLCPIVDLHTVRLRTDRIDCGEIGIHHNWNGVCDVHTRCTTQAGTFRWWVASSVTEQLDQVSTVDHR